jgi:hypothetical protein
MTAVRDLFHPDSPWGPAIEQAGFLGRHHYLGRTDRGLAYRDESGVMVVASATSRRLPARWLELTRWCIVDDRQNAGSRQWGRFVRALRRERPEITTLVSYSDPSVGHDGALYRACNWWWAPTWHRLRPPPSGNGSWAGGLAESVKDRWVYPLGPDPERVQLLIAQDEAVLRRWPWAAYREPGGADHKEFLRQIGRRPKRRRA